MIAQRQNEIKKRNGAHERYILAMQSKQTDIKYEMVRLIKNAFSKIFTEAYFDNPPKDYKVISQYLVKLENEILKKIEKDFADEN